MCVSVLGGLFWIWRYWTISELRWWFDVVPCTVPTRQEVVASSEGGGGLYSGGGEVMCLWCCCCGQDGWRFGVVLG
jgi:hypothetical protein